MDVRCERCKTEYEFDEARITDAGVTVKCTTCGHVFRVKKKTLAVTLPASPDALPGSDKPREWKLRQANGHVLNFKELTTLQKWIVERKVTREDEISITGESWKPIGAIVELAPFFQIVEEANAKKAAPPAPMAPPALSGPNLIRPGPTQPEFKIDHGGRAGDLDQELEPSYRSRKKPKSSGLTVVLMLLLLGAGAYFAFTYVWEPRQREAELNRQAEAAAATKKAEDEEAARNAQLSADGGVPDAGLAVDAGIPAAPDAGTLAAKPPVPPVEEEEVVEEEEEEPAPRARRRPAARLDFDGAMRQADALRDKGRHDKAMDLYGQAAEMEPDRAEPIAGKALVFFEREQFVQAEAAFRQALKLNPRYGVAIMGLAETYRAQDKAEPAIQQFEKYLEVLPNGPDANVAKNALRQLKQ
jgi:predicted Zn finger-like uncharacterized protein